MNLRGRIVTFSSCSGYICKGILYDVENSRGTVIHVHGSYGNFYDNFFIQELAIFYNRAGMNLLAFNMETHGVMADGFKKGDYGYFGGALSSYETSVEDISGAILFAEELGGRIVLQGHSQGTDKVINYLWRTHSDLPAILLSPCDSYRLQELWIEPESVEEQIQRIRNIPDSDFCWLDFKEYGVKSGDEYYCIPITKKAFLSLADGFNFNGFRYESEHQYFHLDNNTFVYLGGKDAFQTSEWHNVKRFFEQRISNVDVHYYPEGDHDMEGIVELVAEDIVAWLSVVL